MADAGDDAVQVDREAGMQLYARNGIEFSDDLEVCFERFALVWPPELSD